MLDYHPFYDICSLICKDNHSLNLLYVFKFKKMPNSWIKQIFLFTSFGYETVKSVESLPA